MKPYYDEILLFDDSVQLNKEFIVEEDFGLSLDWLSDNFNHYEECPFCKTKLVHLLDSDEKISGEFCDDIKFGSLKICEFCNYWQWYYQDPYSSNMYGCPDHYVHASISKLRSYEKLLPDGCHEEIAEALRRDPSLWHAIDPTKFEKLVAAIFKANYKDSEVFHVGRPDDGGVDVIFIDSEDKQWLVQVKRREKPESSEGVGTVRNLLGTMVLQDSSFGAVVSTADHFTFRANEAIGQASKYGKTINLFDRGKLVRMVGALLPSRPWHTFLSEAYSREMASRFAKKWGGKKSKRTVGANKSQLYLFEEN